MKWPRLAAFGVLTLGPSWGLCGAYALDDAPLPPRSSVVALAYESNDEVDTFRRLPALGPADAPRPGLDGRWSMPLSATPLPDEPLTDPLAAVDSPTSANPPPAPTPKKQGGGKGGKAKGQAAAKANESRAAQSAAPPKVDPLVSPSPSIPVPAAAPSLMSSPAPDLMPPSAAPLPGDYLTPGADLSAAYAAPCAPPPGPQPWHLPQPCFLQEHKIAVGGWIEQGITYNAWPPVDRFNGPVATNDRSNEYQLNQLWMFLDRTVDNKGCGFDWGGHVDLCYGTDWRFGKNWGLEDRINAADTFYGLVLPQFYLEAAINDLKIRGGHYATGFGYEVVPAPGNFFYSHSYTMGYGEPLLVSGFQADYRLSDQLVVTGGMNRGWMMFEDWNNTYDFLGGFRWTACDKQSSLSWLCTVGAEDTLGNNQQFVYALVYKEQVTEQLQYVLQHNLGLTDNGNLRDGSNAAWYSIVNYLLYTIDPKWSAGLRFEWFRDEDGTRVGGVGNWIGSTRGWTSLPGFAGDFYELTAGVNWRPCPNVTFRPEIRYDWYSGTTNLNAPGRMPYNAGFGVDQLTVAADLIFTF